MPALIALLFVIYLIVVAIENFNVWGPYAIGATLLGFVVWVMTNHAKVEEQKRQDRENAKQAALNAKIAKEEEEKRRARDEEAARESALNGLDQTIKAAEYNMQKIPDDLRAAEQSVSKAADSFQTRSFYPFWESVADAVENVNAYNEKIKNLDELRTRYVADAAEYHSRFKQNPENDSSPFPASSASLPALRDGAETVNRIDALYEVAHRDYEFSNIYANWRTNRTLIAGFENLSNGLHAIREDLEGIELALGDGFWSVREAITDSTQDISRALSNQAELLADRVDNVSRSADAISEKIASSRQAQGASEEKMIDLLDNIQRGRENLPTIDDAIKKMGTRPVQ